MTIIEIAWALARRVPLWAWIAVAGIAAVFWYGHRQYVEGRAVGRDQVLTEWNASVERGKRELARIADERAEVTTKTETKYVDRIVKVRGANVEIIKEVPVYVPSDTCPVHSSFRVLHDAAIVPAGPVPSPADFVDAPPVSVGAAAATVVANYGTCNETAARLTALQEWVTEQGKVR